MQCRKNEHKMNECLIEMIFYFKYLLILMNSENGRNRRLDFVIKLIFFNILMKFLGFLGEFFGIVELFPGIDDKILGKFSVYKNFLSYFYFIGREVNY